MKYSKLDKLQMAFGVIVWISPWLATAILVALAFICSVKVAQLAASILFN